MTLNRQLGLLPERGDELWSALHGKQLVLAQAKQEAESAAASFSAKHNALEGSINASKPGGAQAAGDTNANAETAPTVAVKKMPAQDTAALVKSAKKRSANQKNLSTFDKRIDSDKQLAENYANWSAVVAGKQRVLLHRGMIGVAIILGILLVGLFFDGWLEHLLGRA